jgi:hypothetical protein
MVIINRDVELVQRDSTEPWDSSKISISI